MCVCGYVYVGFFKMLEQSSTRFFFCNRVDDGALFFALLTTASGSFYILVQIGYKVCTGGIFLDI